jgi:CDP-diacylglycerol--glycerol-3-phosphate 3-phosphatidyltransferase
MVRFIPNMLSGFRLAAVPFLLYLAWAGHKNLFLGLLGLSLLSDALDGYLSRKLQVASDFGTRLDSWGDMATYLTIPVCAWWLWPDIIKQEAVYVVIAIASYVLPILAGLAKFHKIPSYHTWGAKTAAVIMSAAIFILFIVAYPWPFRFAVVFQAVVACEEILITLRLSELQDNVKSLVHLRSNSSD